MKAVLKESKNFHQDEESVEPQGVHKGSMHKLTKDPQPSPSCYRCGGTGHSSDSCYHRNRRCHNCGKQGHIARVCTASQRGKMARSKGKMSKTHLVEADLDSQDSTASDDEGACAEIHKVGSKSHTRN